jgi:hypothetical protein
MPIVVVIARPAWEAEEPGTIYQFSSAWPMRSARIERLRLYSEALCEVRGG